MSNRIRHYLKKEVAEVVPSLHETYRSIGKYQKNRTSRNEQNLLRILNDVGTKLQLFKPHVQPVKRAYFDAILDKELSVSDRIVSFDIAVGTMHIEFPVSRSFSHQESETLRNALDRARLMDELPTTTIPNDGLLCTGIPASPGQVTGKARIVTRMSEYKRLPKNVIVISRMTRPEIILGIENVVGIVTDIGGSLCHAAITAREMGIPCVVGTKHATQVIRNNAYVTVDGSKGIVTRP